MRKIVIIDDNREFGRILSSELTRRGHAVQCAYRGEDGLALVARDSPHLIFLDLRLPDMNGVDVLARVKASCPETEVVVITAYPHLSSALAAIKSHVVDYLCKPFTFDELDPVLERAFARGGRPSRPALPQAGSRRDEETEMIGASDASRALRALIRQLAASGVRAVLVTGESGTGKELVARLLHAEGPRRHGPLVEVNCSAISESLFESELFGCERGAFTGAVASRRGLAEVADGGTLFLDEIAETPLSCQAKLLRFLDDQTFLRVGGTRKSHVDVKIVAATNQDLKAMVARGAFRSDLYYRLNVAPIVLTPLRARPDDIMPVASYWLRRISAQHGRRVEGFTPEVEGLLLGYSWPGNVRELRNLIERLVILCPGERITAAQLPNEFFAPASVMGQGEGADVAFLHEMERARGEDAPAGAPSSGNEPAPTPSLDELGHAHIRLVLAKVNGNKTKAAEILGISRQTLRSKLAAIQ
jgi:DNA-binding NtrC family response regulator